MSEFDDILDMGQPPQPELSRPHPQPQPSPQYAPLPPEPYPQQYPQPQQYQPQQYVPQPQQYVPQPQQYPQHDPYAQQPVRPSKPPSRGLHPAWAMLLTFIACTFCLLWVSTFLPSPGPGPGPNPIPVVDGTYVAMFYDDKGKPSYTEDQKTALDSAATASFFQDNNINWVKVDIDQLDEMKNLNPVYAQMAQEHRTSLPWIVVYGKRKGNEAIQSGDQVIDVVKRNMK